MEALQCQDIPYNFSSFILYLHVIMKAQRNTLLGAQFLRIMLGSEARFLVLSDNELAYPVPHTLTCSF